MCHMLTDALLLANIIVSFHYGNVHRYNESCMYRTSIIVLHLMVGRQASVVSFAWLVSGTWYLVLGSTSL